MPLVPVVAIEFPAETASVQAAALLDSCNLALGAGSCVSSPGTASRQDCAWTASLRVAPEEPAQLLLELRDSNSNSGPPLLTRVLGFDPDEEPAHRWSTAGAVLAALVVAAEAGRPSEGDEPRAASKPAPIAAPKTTLDASRAGPDPRRRLRFDLGGLLGSGLGDSPRLGVRLRPAVELTRHAFVWMDFAYSRASSGVEVGFWSAASGVGFQLESQSGSRGLAGRCGLRGDALVFRASRDGQTERTSQLRLGAIGAIDTTLAISRTLALWLTAEGSVLAPELEIRVGSQPQGELGRLDGSVSLGFRYQVRL